MCIWHAATDIWIQWIQATNSCSSSWIHQASFGPIDAVTFNYQYKPQKKMYIVSFHDSNGTSPQFFITDATQYWPFATEYSLWNEAVAALQFWMADLDPQTLSNAIEQVYTAFFCSNSAQL